jgi:hypothetical protein
MTSRDTRSLDDEVLRPAASAEPDHEAPAAQAALAHRRVTILDLTQRTAMSSKYSQYDGGPALPQCPATDTRQLGSCKVWALREHTRVSSPESMR